MKPYKVDFTLYGIAYSAVVMCEFGTDEAIQTTIANKWGITGIPSVQILSWWLITDELVLL